MKAERDENVQRKDLVASERVALAKDLAPLERKAAKDRKSGKGEKRPGGIRPGKCPGRAKGEARDTIARWTRQEKTSR